MAMKLAEVEILPLYDKDKNVLKATLKIAIFNNKIGIFFESNGGSKGEESNPHYNDAINHILKILNEMGITQITAYHAPYMKLKNVFIKDENIGSINHKIISSKLQNAGGPPNGPIYITSNDEESIKKGDLKKLSEEVLLQEYLKKGTRSFGYRNPVETLDESEEETEKNHSFLIVVVGIVSVLLGGYFLYRHLKKVTHPNNDN
ncbi:hypothetical protein [Akkermansia sp.]|uniref:hypothetical protein n=1 Tax=Akkermansia sp. TaxID=1872421 RepID=UPI0025C001DC|nr:hypothetical protein [Akkermansia sp.]